VSRTPTHGWRAWHWGGEVRTVYSSAETRWQELPRLGIVGVVEYREPPYRLIWDGHDWIWVEGGAFLIVPTHPEWGQWAEAPTGACNPCLKRGAGVPDGVWIEIQREMMEAREWPST
jgi:hypothetical protein